MLESMLGNPLLARLGWTLVHSLWQGVALTVLVSVGLLLIRNGRSGARYALAASALLLWIATPVATFTLVASQSTTTSLEVSLQDWLGNDTATAEARPGEALTNRPLPGNGAGRSFGQVIGLETMIGVARTHGLPLALNAFGRVLPFAGLAWLVITSLLSLRLLGALLIIERLRGRATPLPSLQTGLDGLAAQLGIVRNVQLMESANVEVPTVFGLLKPVILLPASALTGLTHSQLELLLAHELAHIRRHDYLINLLQGTAEALLFYHPLTWYISRTLRVEREHAADDLALRATGSPPLALAEALTQMERNLQPPAPALASTGNLVSRVQRLLGHERIKIVRASALPPSLAVVLLTLSLALGTAQPVATGDAWSIVIDPGHSDEFPGVVGPLTEQELVLKIARKLAELLEQEDVKVRFSHDANTTVATSYRENLQARADTATPEHDLLISLHANASANPRSRGIETFVVRAGGQDPHGQSRYQASRRLAGLVQQQLVERTGSRDLGVKENDLYILRAAQTPAVLVNVGFLSNPDEGARLATDDYQGRSAQGLADALLAYLEGGGR